MLYLPNRCLTAAIFGPLLKCERLVLELVLVFVREERREKKEERIDDDRN